MAAEDTQVRVATALAALGLPRGAAVLVHSSLKALGPLPGGAEAVIRGCLDALGPAGTLLFPALSYAYCDAAHPVFDVLRTPSNVGALPEYFRRRAGTLRSINPTHSVCGVGAQAEWLLKDHLLDDTPGGAHSSYRLLREVDGYVLFLGCGLAPNTSMHAVEELVNPPYLFGGPVVYTAILPDGQAMHLPCRRHNFAGYKQRYDRIAPLLADGGLRTGKVLQAEAHLLRCRPMWERALEALQHDALYFVERSGGAISKAG